MLRTVIQSRDFNCSNYIDDKDNDNNNGYNESMISYLVMMTAKCLV